MQMPVPYGSKLHIPPTNYHLLAVQREPYKKAYLLTKWTMSRKMMIEKATGLDRKTNEAIGKRNRMTAPRFQTGG